jgi:cytoskeletal protein CcmA (bactofilin family)
MADEPQRHRIRIECPECGNSQPEPAMVVSTQCRNCRSGISVIDGKCVARKTSTVRVAKSPPEAMPEPPAPLPAAPPKPTFRETLQRLLNPPTPPRELTCFGCHHHFTASGNAQSSQCPKCCGYLSLLDHEITTLWERSIKTCGNVVIRKNGIFNAASLACHHLTLLGSIHCPVVCSGDLVIRTHAKINHPVHCRNLIVEKGSRVEFLGTVHAETARIHGNVRGQLTCTGQVTLQKRSQFHGLVRTTSLVVQAGAHHFGTVEIISADTTPPNPTS